MKRSDAGNFPAANLRRRASIIAGFVVGGSRRQVSRPVDGSGEMAASITSRDLRPRSSVSSLALGQSNEMTVEVKPELGRGLLSAFNGEQPGDEPEGNQLSAD